MATGFRSPMRTTPSTRYLRFREGINGDSGTDDVDVASGDTMMFDHISASWGPRRNLLAQWHTEQHHAAGLHHR